MLNFFSPYKKESVKNILRDLAYYSWKFFGPNKKTINPKEIKKVLVMDTGVIGDLIIITPMMNALAKNYGKVDILLREDMKDILSGNCNIKNFFFYKNEGKTLRLLKERNYDLVIIFSRNDKELKEICLKAKIPYIIGNSFFYPFVDIFLTARAKENSKQHFVQKTMDQARLVHADLKPKDIKTEFYISQKDEEYIKKLLRRNRIKDYVLIHAGKRGSEKNPKISRFFWPAKNFADVIDYIIEKYKLPVVLSGSSMEKERNQEIFSFVRNKNKVFNFCEKTSLKQWACLIKKAKLLVSLNTGATHIASCFNTKTIVINEEFPELWHPWMPSKNYRILLYPSVEQVGEAIDMFLK
jgi:ADP-heptose:LPS heptosyltransferase